MTPSSNQQHIAFFKPKKEKVYHQRRENSKAIKMGKSLLLLQILQRKIYTNMKPFFVKSSKKSQLAIGSKMLDESSIFTHITKHMIYLTGNSLKQR